MRSCMNRYQSSVIITDDGSKCLLRKLAEDDSLALTGFFRGLSLLTRSRFGPHPLSAEFAQQLCDNLSTDSATRFVVDLDGKIIGYFILESQMSEHEAARYLQRDITLQSEADLLFAPCIADNYQNNGLASKVMQALINYYKERATSFVLMGGTQETNHRARNFYKKFGFQEFGGYQTDVYNIDMRLLF